MDLIKKEKFADNINSFVLRKKYFNLLIQNVEMNKVTNTFLSKIMNHIIKIVRYLLIIDLFKQNELN